MRRIMRCAMVAVVLLICTAAGLAQTSQGRILGTVSDASGAVVTDAKRTITNTATGVSRILTTTGAGEYAAPNLNAGPYIVTAEAAGFKKEQRVGLLLEVAQDIRVDLQLVPGATQETGTVSGEAPI
jgi:hypothetical protein